jgi:hypothetical protein
LISQTTICFSKTFLHYQVNAGISDDGDAEKKQVEIFVVYALTCVGLNKCTKQYFKWNYPDVGACEFSPYNSEDNNGHQRRRPFYSFPRESV